LGKDGVRILLCDDNKQLLHVLRASLVQEGYSVWVAENGSEALLLVEQVGPDLIILDVLMPKVDGWSVCDRLRKSCDVAIIFLTVRRSETDVIKGLSLGADDYLTKPFSLAELHARVAAKLRRADDLDVLSGGTVYTDGILAIDLTRGLVTRNGQDVALSPKEFQILALLARNQGNVVSHDAILRHVWGKGYEGERAYLAIYVRYLRKKIEDDASNPRYIKTHRGEGYSLAGLCLAKG